LNKLISIVTPIYNEKDVLEFFFHELNKCFININYEYEIICVNDGSTDGTFDLLKSITSKNYFVKVINLSKNYGKEIALTAGIDNANGDAVIPIDCDLQDPVSVIPLLIEEWDKGFDIVLARRIDRSSDSFIKRNTSKIFYKLIDKISDVQIPSNVGDFRLMDRKAIIALRGYRERSRFMKGIMASLGFKQTTVEYKRAPRVDGKTKWSYWKLYLLALEGIVSFTSLPLKIWSYLGASVAFGAFIYGAFLIIKTLLFGIDTPGYASLMVVFLFMSGLILLCLGVIGEYLARIFIESKDRPLYIIDEKINFNLDEK
jgi:glycosyltransferase involved in cell wall biosynthesis